MYIQSTQYMGWASEFDWHQLSISLGTLVAAYRQALQDNFPMKNSPDSEVKRKLIVIWQKNYSMIQWQKLFLVIAVTIPIYTMLKHHTWVGETHLKLWDRQFFTEKKVLPVIVAMFLERVLLLYSTLSVSAIVSLKVVNFEESLFETNISFLLLSSSSEVPLP